MAYKGDDHNMEWKSYYRREMELPETKGYLEELFSQTSNSDVLIDLIAKDAILSFPHTSVHYAGAIQTQVVSALYRSGVDQVIALGVFHAWGLKPYATLYQKAMNKNETTTVRLAAFSKLAGAFSPIKPFQETPFGPVPLSLPLTEKTSIMRPDEGVFRREFSLDTFLSLIRFYADLHKVDTLHIMPIYIGMTRNPLTGSFDLASRLAAVIQQTASANTAIVTTGDLVHYGTAYSSKERMARMPSITRELEVVFLKELQQTLDLALIEKNYADAFYRADTILNNDQRYLLPLIAELLKTNAGYKILSFRLSDYAPILDVDPPCVVASSLVAYIPAKAESR